jgi:hypothetical protein
MAGPEDEMAAGEAGRGSVRAYREREQAIKVLKAAFVQGLLAKDEFDLRLGQAFAARTYAELVAVTADLPAGLPAAQPKPARARAQQPVLRPGPAIIAANALWAGVWAYVFLLSPKHSDNGLAFNLFWAVIFTCLGVLIMTGGHVLASRHEKRSGRQLPRRPAAGAGGQASQRSLSADPAGQLPPIDHGQQHTAEAARSRLFRSPLPGSRSPRRWRPVWSVSWCCCRPVRVSQIRTVPSSPPPVALSGA